MQASDYLKMKFQSDRQLAIYGQQGVAGTWKALKGIGSDIYSGMERVSWYSSCLIPSYHDVCDELLSEEKRMYLSIVSLYRYRDVIAQMLYLYFKSVLNDSENGNEQNRARKTGSQVTGLVKNIPTSKAARFAIAWGVAIYLSKSGLLSEIVVERLARRVPNVVMAFQLIGTDQKCALAARRLKTLDPKYYATLYAAQLEMLYYFIEPFLSELIKKVQMGFYRDFEAIYDDLRDKCVFKSLLSILFTDILFTVYVFVCASFFLWLVPDHWVLLTFIAIGVFIIVHPIIFGRFDKYD